MLQKALCPGETAKDLIVDAYADLQDLLDNGDVTGKDSGIATKVSNFLAKVNETDSVYTAIRFTTDASEALECAEVDSSSGFYTICAKIASALIALAADVIQG